MTSVKNSLELINEFGNISGLKLNVEKTKAIWLGPQKFNESKPLGLKWTKEPVRALGMFISYNEKENTKKPVELKIDNMSTKLSAIPNYLFEKARTHPHIDTRNILNSTTYQFSLSVIIDIAKMKCRDYYWRYINATKIKPSGTKKWHKELGLEDFN